MRPYDAIQLLKKLEDELTLRRIFEMDKKELRGVLGDILDALSDSNLLKGDSDEHE